ncbi:MAG: hypothetical protein ACRDTZ_04635 [Pseudonocardiaceae bacterium]
MAIISVDEVNDHLSSPPWSQAQRDSVARRIDKLQADLAAWLQCPIDPEPRAESVPVAAKTGLVLATWPIYHLQTVDGLACNGVPPPGYTWTQPYRLALTTPDVAPSDWSSRPFSLLHGVYGLRTVVLTYLAGWGPHRMLRGALLDKTAAYATNRHDDTVVARELDATAPPAMKEEWTEQELTLLRSFKVRGITS